MAWDVDASQERLGGRWSPLPLDQALEYLLASPGRVLPGYVLAMAPFTLCVLWLVDVVSALDSAAMPLVAAALTLATFWRWIVQAWVQRRIQNDLRGQPPLPLRGRIASILLLRLYANFLLTWGGLLIVLPIPGLFLSGFATPLMLEREGPTSARIAEGFKLLASRRRLLPLALALSAISVWAIVAVVAVHLLLLKTLLPQFLGIDTSELTVTLTGGAWLISVSYFLFIALDLYWTVASVFLFYDLLSRRLGTDLLRRVQTLAAELPPGQAGAHGAPGGGP